MCEQIINAAAAKEGVKKSSLQNLWRDLNIDLLVFVKCKFLRIHNYSVIPRTSGNVFKCNHTVRERKNTEYSCTWIYLKTFLSISFGTWWGTWWGKHLYPVTSLGAQNYKGAQCAPELSLRSTEFTRKPNFSSLYCYERQVGTKYQSKFWSF